LIVLNRFTILKGEVMAESPGADADGQVPTLVVRGLVKHFGPVIALARAELEVRPGEIHALVGENGAGKSTLVKLLAGVYQPTAGQMLLDGEPLAPRTPADARDAGIAVIYQEPTLFPDLSVAENVFMGRLLTGRGGMVSRRAMRDRTRELLATLGVEIDPDRPALGLSIADQQLVEIVKAVSLDAKLLVMDEPTAALSGVEVDRLFAVARQLRDRGAAVVFISHRFDEIFALCDRITVMRDGEHVSTQDTATTDVATIVRQMVGRSVDTMFPRTGRTAGDVVLEVEGLTRAGTFEGIDLHVRAGEILGIAGLVGSGRSEVVRAVFGIDPYDSGTVRVDGALLAQDDPEQAMRRGLALVPEDRRRQGLHTDLSVARNVALTLRRRLSRGGILTSGAEYRVAHEWAATLQVRARDLDTVAGTLSGGNQQKVVLAKWLSTRPRVLIIDEPTRGIDVGTKAEVHRLLDRLAGEGVAVLMISSELPEVLGMSDRVLVMREGRVTAVLDRADADPETVMAAATGAVA